jgi:hypothetical protein
MPNRGSEKMSHCTSSDGDLENTTKYSTLYEMYDRMLLKVDKVHQSKVIAALAMLLSSPDLELQKLAEGVIIDPKSNPPFNIRNRLLNPNWILDILSCFDQQRKERLSKSVLGTFHRSRIPQLRRNIAWTL